MSASLPYYLAFSYCLGIGPMRFRELLDHFKTVEKAYQAGDEEIRQILDVKTAPAFIKFRQTFKPDSILSQLYKKSIQVITLEDKEYPEQLANISDPPICLYLIGDKKVLTYSREGYFAIVGTRRATSYGLQVAKSFGLELALSGLVIVSGMALGIDSASHWGAIEAKGKTIAVLGCGVDVVYPPSNRKLYETIIQKDGAIISEFPPGHTVLPGLFVARNRIISGLSRGVLVVEGAEDSGALITARNAAEQGRDVFAPPAPITSNLSKAPNLLIKQGAKFVTSVSDILEEYDIAVTTKQTQAVIEKFDGISREIIQLLLNEPASADDIKQVLKKPLDEVLNAITLLEISGTIAKNHEGKYFCSQS